MCQVWWYSVSVSSQHSYGIRTKRKSAASCPRSRVCTELGFERILTPTLITLIILHFTATNQSITTYILNFMYTVKSYLFSEGILYLYTLNLKYISFRFNYRKNTCISFHQK